MAVFKCKMCGGALEINSKEGRFFYTTVLKDVLYLSRYA